MNLLRVPKIQMFLALFGVAVFAIAGNFSFGIILRYSIIFGFTVGFEYILWKIRKIDPFLPSASFVTATIIFLLSEPTTLIYFPLIAVVFAILQKQFIRPWGNHIFNPAAFGLLASAYFGNIVSWWGPNMNLITMLLVLLASGYVSAIRVGQWKIQLPFLLTQVIISRSLGQLWVGAFLFFAFVVLPEPMTAAKNNWTKPFYGILVAALPFLLLKVTMVADIELAALLIGNLIFKFIDKAVG